jgi:hypothetical protein
MRHNQTSTWALAICVSALAACGTHTKASTTEPAPPPNGPAPLTDKPELPKAPTNPTKNPTEQSIWAAFEDSFLLRKYDATGSLVTTCDLSKAAPDLTSGGITALTLAKENTLLALIDPGDSAEQIVAVSTVDCKVSNWFSPSPQFSKLHSNKIVVFPATSSEYLRVFVARDNGVDRFTWTTDGVASRATGPNDSPFVPLIPSGAGNCAADSVTGIGQLGEGEGSALIVLTHGPRASRLNIVGSLMGGSSGSPLCLSSFNYAAEGQPTNANDVPVQAVQTNDKRVFVLYSNPASGAKLVRYDFNGTTLSSPFLLSQDQDDLGFAPEAFAMANSSNFLVATGSFLSTIEISSGRLLRRMHDAPWTTRISALARE